MMCEDGVDGKARTTKELVLFIIGLKREDLDQVNQSEPPTQGISRYFLFATSLSPTTSMSFESYKPRHFEHYKPRNRYMYAACICLAAVSFVGLLSTAMRTMVPSPPYRVERDASCSQSPMQSRNHLDPMNFLNGPPTERFRGSLCFSIDLNAIAEDIYL